MKVLRTDQSKRYVIMFTKTKEFFIKDHGSFDPHEQITDDIGKATLYKTLANAKSAVTSHRNERKAYDKRESWLKYRGIKSCNPPFKPRWIFNILGYEDVEIIELVAITEYTELSSTSY